MVFDRSAPLVDIVRAHKGEFDGELAEEVFQLCHGTAIECG